MKILMAIFIFICLLFNSCFSSFSDKKSDTINVTKIDLIHELIKEVGFISLPYKTVFDPSIDRMYRIQHWDKDSILVKEFLIRDIYVVGALPDTSEFYSFIFITMSAVSTPNLVTFNKQGNMISFKRLIEDFSIIYGGEILDCEEYAIIDKKLNIKSYFRSRVVYETQYFEVYDTICSHFETNGKINPTGEIVFEDRQIFECE